MELLAGGEIKWRNDKGQPILHVDQTRRILRDAILGLEYCTSLLSHKYTNIDIIDIKYTIKASFTAT